VRLWRARVGERAGGSKAVAGIFAYAPPAKRGLFSGFRLC
jgi:hypothetical protein